MTAGRAANSAFTGLLAGLGAVALLVGGVGVANTMVISALERRADEAWRCETQLGTAALTLARFARASSHGRQPPTMSGWLVRTVGSA